MTVQFDCPKCWLWDVILDLCPIGQFTYVHLDIVFFFLGGGGLILLRLLFRPMTVIKGFGFIASDLAAAGSSVEAIRVLGTWDERTTDTIYTFRLNNSNQNCCHAT